MTGVHVAIGVAIVVLIGLAQTRLPDPADLPPGRRLLSSDTYEAPRPSSLSRSDLYHRIQNCEGRGDLITLCNELGLVGNAVEIGVWHGGFSRHNLLSWKGAKYHMVDPWTFRKNDTTAGAVSSDKNFRDEKINKENMDIAMAAVKPWLETGRAVVHRMFSEPAADLFPDEHFDFIYGKCFFLFSHHVRSLRGVGCAGPYPGRQAKH